MVAANAEGAADTRELTFSQEDLARPFTPLRIPLYRSFWIAGLVSNMGTWMHETGAQWMMTSLDPSPAMVAAVRTSMTIPLFCLALPAGVWVDRVDRRRWLLCTQIGMLCVASLMAILAAFGWMTPSGLLCLTALMGVGMVLNQPAWQSLTPELVPPALVPSAVSVGSIAFNLARSLGPFLAGLMIAIAGTWFPFVLNAFSYLAVVSVVLLWRKELAGCVPAQRSAVGTDENHRMGFWSELQKGLGVIRGKLEVRNALLRITLFAFPASILWSLLALVATEKLQFQERGFGLCLGIIGAGAVAGGTVLPRFRSVYPSEQILLATKLAMSVLLACIGLSTSRFVTIPSLALIGICWMTTMTTLNATAQVYLPKDFRARGMSAFMMAFAIGMGGGSLAWGWLAKATSLSATFVTAGAVMVCLSLLAHPLSVGTLRHIARQPTTSAASKSSDGNASANES